MAKPVISTSYDVDVDEAWAKKLREAQKKVRDLTIPLTLIAQDFFKSRRAIFKLKSEGQYPDLNEVYKERKQNEVGFAYPILKYSGRLEKSITNPAHPEAIINIVNKKALDVGTKVPYGIFHQEGTKNIPQRKFLFVGPESIKNAGGDSFKGTAQRWAGIIDNYLADQLSLIGKSNSTIKPDKPRS